jgi:hypothetical protein
VKKNLPETVVKEREFQPTDNMLAAVQFARENNFDKSGPQCAAAAGGSRTNWYAWVQKSAFVRWWYGEADDHFIGLLPQVWAASFKRSTGVLPVKEGGDPRDAKLLAERFDNGYVPRSKQIIAAKMALGKAKPADETLIDELLDATNPDPDE